MAVDRAIDSTEFDSKLTTVADAIRSAGGTTEPMSFPSGMVEAITAIQAGGGGGNFATGTFTTTDDITSNVVINHNLGVKPKFIIVVSAEWSAYSKSKPELLSFYYIYQYTSTSYGIKYQAPAVDSVRNSSENVSNSGSGTIGGWYRVNVDETTFTLKQANISSTYGIGASRGFFWLAYGE